ncbi:unnamed protein product, partial [Prorocentrum cordatum]
VLERKRKARAELAERRAGKPLFHQLQQLGGKMAAVDKKLGRQRDEVVPDLERRLARAQEQGWIWARELESLRQETAALAQRLAQQQQQPAYGGIPVVAVQEHGEPADWLQVRGIGWVASFALYLFTGKPVTWHLNAAVLDEVVHWIAQLCLRWIAVGDFSHESVVKQGMESFVDRAIDFFWLDGRLASVLDPAQSFEHMPCWPHRPTWIRSAKPWRAYRVKALKGPRQYTTERPPPVAQPTAPLEYPKVDLERGPRQQQQLDAGWQRFCTAAEAELRALFGWGQADARRYEGRGLAPEVVEGQLPPQRQCPIAERGPARAWRRAAGALAWIGGLAPAEARLAQAAVGTAPLHVEPWGVFLAPVLREASNRVPTVGIAKLMLQLQRFTRSRAQTLEQGPTRQRAARSYEKLSDNYPGSGGYLCKICHWRHAWKGPISSVRKVKLAANPRSAVNTEAQEWASTWGADDGSYDRLWQAQGAQLERHSDAVQLPLDAQQVRAIRRSYKWRTGFGLGRL